MPEYSRFRQLLLQVCVDPANIDETVVRNLYDDIINAYSEKHRAYHTLQHIDECLAMLDQHQKLARHPVAVALALWLHDVVYFPRRGDNEERSAQWARDRLGHAMVSAELCEQVAQSILATKNHQVDYAGPDRPDQYLVNDIDMAILGAERERFDEYEHQIRREYRWVPDFIYRNRRGKFLQHLLDRKHIYFHQAFAELEQKARSNVQRLIKHLAKSKE